MHHQRSQCEGDDEDDNVLAEIPYIGLMDLKPLEVFDNSIDHMDFTK